MKKKITLLMMLAFLGLNIGALRAQDPGAYPGDGVGVQGDPYLVSTVEQMQWIADYVNSGTIGTGAIHCELQNDIDLSSINWVAIGCNGSFGLDNDYTFSGSFDGKNHTVTLKIDATEYADDVVDANDVNVGLFGAANGTIKNLTVAGEINGGEYDAAGICCSMRGEILNCHNVAKVISNEGTACGICVHSTGNSGNPGVNITDCSNFGSISGIEACGILGGSGAQYYNDQIKNCGNYGTIIGYVKAAGIMGDSDEDVFDRISLCYNFGSIEAGAFAAGIKYGGGGTIFENCFNSGSVTAKGDIEEFPFGIAGGIFCSPDHGQYMEMVGSYNAGIVSGHGIAGGLIGMLPELGGASENHLFILSSYNIGNVNCGEMEAIPEFDLPAGAYAGSIVGLLLEDRLSFTNVYYDKQMCPVGGVNGVDETGITPLLTEEMTDPDLDMGEYEVAWGETPLFDIPLFTYTEGLYPQSVFFADEYEEVFSPTALQKAASIVSVTPAFLQNEENVNEVKTDFEVGNENGVTWATTLPFDYDINGNVSVTGRGAGTLTVSKTEGGITLNKVIDMTSVKCWAGSGTEADPYQIVDADGLVCLTEKVNAGESYAGVYFKVTADIDLSSVCSSSLGGWVPIGDDFNGFKGEFDGNHKIISNLYINNSDDYNQGLFGYINSASIKDVTVSGTVTASRSRAAGLVGLCVTSEISGCVNNAIVSGYEGVGGIAGMAISSNFSSCTNNGSISLTSQHAGGICGEFLYGSMTDCSNSGEISGPVGIGGLVGVLVPVFPIEQANGYMMSGCSNAATVTATVLAAGGVCGGIQFVEIGSSVGVDDGKPYSILKDCTNSGAISCPMAVGGICGGALYPEDLPSGKSSWSSMSDWLVDGQSLLGSPAAFGVVEEMNENVLTNCTNTGMISGQNYVGGISGGLFSGGVISGCSNQGSVTATGEMAGGVLGYANDHGNIKPQILNCSNFNNVTGKQNVAGIVGNIVDGSVSGCYNTGMISSGMFVGGIVGLNGAIVEKCFNLGNINGQISDEIPATVAGGVVGGSYSGHVADCYNAGMVSGYGVTGGVAGVIQFHNEDFDYDGENLYNVGQVTCVPIYNVDLGEGPLDFNYRAGISPLAYESKINNCYYDKQMCTAAEPTVQYSNSGGAAGGTATNCAAMLTSAMTNGSWIPGGSAFTASNGLYPQLTAFTASPATALDQAASIVSVTPAFLNGVENVEGVATSPFTVGTGNSVSWSAVSPFSYDEGEVSFSTEGTGTLTVSKTVSDITVSKDIVMTTIIEDVCWAGSGTEADPYQIVDADGLVCLAEKVNAGEPYEGVYFKMMNDIDLSSVCGESVGNWTPIGNASDSQFEGIFNGGNNAIESLYISDEYSEYQGLFGRIENAEISGLTIRNSLIEGRDYVAAICGDAIGSIFNNCHNASSVNLIGSGSKAHVSIGGICAEAEDSRFISCSNSGCVDDSKATPTESCYVAGICSYGQGNTSFLNCYNTGAIIGDESSGICSSLEDEASIAYCYNTGTIIGKEIGGGICASTGGTIANCYNVGLVQGTECASGIVASMGGGNIESCFNMGEIIYLVSEENPGMCFAAGISGVLDGATASNCYNTGNVLGFGAAGGLFGLVEDSEIENCYNVGQVNCDPFVVDENEIYDFKGGIVGIFDTESGTPSILMNCYYDKQMCTAPNAYYTFDEETGEFLGVHGADYQKLTTEMVGSALLSEYTDGWTFVGSGYTALYPQLTAFVESENDIDNEASLVSVRPMFLAETDNVDHVYTSPFTVGIDDDEEWSHVSGEELLTFKTDGTVEWEDYGTETVAVTNMTHTFITKQIKLNTLNLQDITWVDWVTEAPSGFNPANIDSPEDLAWFISCVNGYNGSDAHPYYDARITADIDMSAHYWVPIGFVKESTSKSDDYVVFGGDFDGMFRSISGIRIDSDVLKDRFHAGSALCLGMFGKTNNACIMNVILTGGSIQANSNDVVGGLVGEQTGGRIDYSEAAVDITGHDALMGGLVGRAQQGFKDSNTTNIYNSFSASTITGNGIIGGLVAELGTNCCLYSAYSSTKFNYSAGSGKSELMGGLVGDNKGRVGGCYVRPISGSVQSESFGTLAGNNDGVFVDCFVPKNGFGTSGFMASGSGSCTYIGTFTDAQYPFTYTQTENCVIEQVTESNSSFPVVPVVGTTTLVNALNNWVLRNMMNPEWDFDPDPDWGCFGCNINGNYPVHCYYDWANIQQTDYSRPMAVSTVNGNVLYYHQYLSDAVKKYNALDGGGIIGVWGSEDMKGKDGQENDEDVQIYLNPVTCMSAEYSSYIPGMSCFGSNAGGNADDWYVSLLQDDDKELTVHDGINWDNSYGHAHASDGTELHYDWHLFSSPVSAPTGINYTDQTTSYNHWTGHDSPEYGFMEGVDGYFPEDTDYGKFDLYAWSEKDYHWINLKNNSASHWHHDGVHEQIEYANETSMVPGKGYMMALDKKMLLQSHGVLNNGHIEIPVTAEGEFLTGYNLLGNPYQSSLDFNLFAANENNASLWPSEGYTPSYLVYNADKDCYEAYAVGTSASDATAPRYLWPHQGFYVLCGEAAAGSKAHFENDMRVILYNAGGYDTYFRGDETPSYPLVNMFLKDSNGSGDVLVVELDRPELGGAEKMRDVKAGKGILYAHYAGNDYSILFAQGHVSEVPVHFVADESGEFTIMMNTQNGTFSYLHLIDNLTGCDVDMLTNSEYRFTSSTSDYASRFKLVFEYTGVEEDIDSDADGTFAFQMGEQIVVNGEGTLEIVDVQGRILRSERLSGVQSVVVPSVAKGLYLLRLSGSDSVKVQKIVIK